MIRQREDGVAVDVWVQPRSSRNAVVGIYQDRIHIRLTAPPVDGAANEALCAFVAQSLRCPVRQVSVERGQKGRRKTLLIAGTTEEHVRRCLGC